MTTCAGPDCDLPTRAHGLCAGHYMQRRRGQTLRPLSITDPDHCPTCQEAAWLAEAGECRERVAQRLSMRLESFERHLMRHRPALLARLPLLPAITPTPYR